MIDDLNAMPNGISCLLCLLSWLSLTNVEGELSNAGVKGAYLSQRRRLIARSYKKWSGCLSWVGAWSWNLCNSYASEEGVICGFEMLGASEVRKKLWESMGPSQTIAICSIYAVSGGRVSRGSKDEGRTWVSVAATSCWLMSSPEKWATDWLKGRMLAATFLRHLIFCMNCCILLPLWCVPWPILRFP